MSISVRDLNFKYTESGVSVLKDFSAEFPGGAVTGIVGDNGVGKTTLARLIVGILKPLSGQITCDGTDISKMTLAETGRRIGYVMQNPSKQIFSPTVEEEIKYGLLNLKISAQEAERRIESYLKLFALEDKREMLPFNLSYGEKQRLVIASIAAMDPKYIILDEPTSGLDAGMRRTLGETIAKLNKGIVVISHDHDFIEEYCDRRVHMVEPYG